MSPMPKSKNMLYKDYFAHRNAGYERICTIKLWEEALIQSNVTALLFMEDYGRGRMAELGDRFTAVINEKSNENLRT